MSIVKQHIRYLAAVADCVILPGWGGLIACHRQARVEGGMMLPPSRSMVFNPALTHDDGRLAMSMMRREGMSYDAARAEIAAEVAAMRAEYEATGQTVIPRVGSFSRTPDGSMVFTADTSGVADARYLYLSPVTVAAASEEAAMPGDVNIMRPARESLGRRVLRMAAFVAILIGLAVTLSTPITVSRDSEPDFAGIGGKIFTSAPAAETASATEADDINRPLRFTITVPDSAIAVAPVAPHASAIPAEEPRYYLIIGSHASQAKAERWMASRSEKNLGIVHGGSRYRVYAATGSTIEEAMALKSDPEFARRHPDAWVYRRR